MYEYRAKIVSVYDGDSVRADIDLGFGVWLNNQAIRLARINKPEIRGEEKEEGLRAKQRLLEILGYSTNDCIIKVKKYNDRGKYGRIIAELWVETGTTQAVSVNEMLLNEGYATKYQG